ncbi:hypothetical protein C2S52_013775 [Perilla frutescens var. hirtella]|nr:hypothetical protein C2S52_013775 [Perilla frutescens var. hirtella]
MYNPFLEKFAAQDMLRISSSVDQKVNLIQEIILLAPGQRFILTCGSPGILDWLNQDCGLSTTCSLLSSLPLHIRRQIEMNLVEEKAIDKSGRAVQKVAMKSKEEAADCLRKILRRKVMVSSARQAVAGLVTVGAVHGLKYVGKKMKKAWRSWW